MIITNFLSGLPSQNPNNFERWTIDGQTKQNVTKRPSSYVTTKDIPSQQGSF